MPRPSSELIRARAELQRPAETASSVLDQAEEDWVSLQIRSLSAAWDRGDQVTVEELLRRRPDLSTENALRLIYEEVCLRREAGDTVSTVDILRRFPQWETEIEVLLRCDELLWPLAAGPSFPEVHEQIGPFYLLAELGHGASGKTFLATELALASRLVVLKLVPDDQDEHLSLARLQHTHIIPLFSEQTFPDRGLRALCMPYVGGTTLAKVLDVLGKVPIEERSGRRLLETLDRIQATHPSSLVSLEGPYRRYLEQSSYVESICWITACLADALQEAHARGLVHMDVKPSNVLIAADGTPMLLDFHLARKPIRPGEKITDRLGGTPGWMAPEQQAALDAVREGRPVSESVDHRADLYALGLMMCEAFEGRDIASGAAGAWNRARRSKEVTTGLGDIVEKCLAPRPIDRYPDALTLADDLRRHLNHLPLRGTLNRSLAERWQKWRRREPWALAGGMTWLSALATLLIAGFLGLAYSRQRIHEAETDLEDGRRLAADHQFSDAVRLLTRGRERLSRIPGTARLATLLETERDRARIGQQANELRNISDMVRFWYGTKLPAGESASELARRIRGIWDDRELLLPRDQGDVGIEFRQGIKTDLRELAIVWVNLRVQLASEADREVAYSEALRMLEQVEATCGPSAALDRERQGLAQGRAPATSLPEVKFAPQSAWEHYELGRSYLRSRLLRQAASEFQQALDLRPQDFWPNFYQGLCAFELRDLATAGSAFRTCIALVPSSAECYYNRARVSDALGESHQAFRDYSRALELNPQLAQAALNRGILFYKAGRQVEAIADLTRAIQTSTDSEMIGRIHFNLALAYRAKGDHKAAQASVQEALSHGYHQARELREKLLH
jgi:serine/threonine protein kinase/tetratricopeptide (TPR) repeat protein